MSRVIHFEIPVNDVKKAVDFYGKAFGWKIDQWGGEQQYWLCKTGEEGQPGIDGAIMPRENAGEGTLNTIDVESIDVTAKMIVQLGGKQLGDIAPIPGVGRFCYFLDPEGNKFGVMQSERS